MKYYITNAKSERNPDGLASTEGLGRLSYRLVYFTSNQGNKAWKDDQKRNLRIVSAPFRQLSPVIHWHPWRHC